MRRHMNGNEFDFGMLLGKLQSDILQIRNELKDQRRRIKALEILKRSRFDLAEFIKGPWGKLALILALLAAQVPVKEALLAVLK